MGGPGELETQQIPLMSPAQQQMLSQLLAGTMQGMQGFPLGQAYGGPTESSWQPMPFMGDEYKAIQAKKTRQGAEEVGSMFGGNMPGKVAGIKRRQATTSRPPIGGGQEMPGAGVQDNASLMANLLAGPMPNTMTQGMTGNIPKFRSLGM